MHRLPHHLPLCPPPLRARAYSRDNPLSRVESFTLLKINGWSVSENSADNASNLVLGRFLQESTNGAGCQPRLRLSPHFRRLSSIGGVMALFLIERRLHLSLTPSLPLVVPPQALRLLEPSQGNTPWQWKPDPGRRGPEPGSPRGVRQSPS